MYPEPDITDIFGLCRGYIGRTEMKWKLLFRVHIVCPTALKSRNPAACNFRNILGSGYTGVTLGKCKIK